ncbi:MAG: Do family serine endopeptidase [Hyphomicrobiaceae bacterium]
MLVAERSGAAQMLSARVFTKIGTAQLAIISLFAGIWYATIDAAAEGPRSVAPLAKRLSGAVVNISTSQRVSGPSGIPLPNVPENSPFEDLFKDFFDKKGEATPQSRKVSSLGSGFVIDGKKGLIVTNNHVIEGADEITINFNDGSKLKVDRVLGKDPKTDLALLKVTPPKTLTAVKFGSSDELEVGDWVLAIGNPFGLGGSVSIGIISAKQRDIQSGPYDDYLQTDAAINKGNSGGPLFNMKGEVIGVNTAIFSVSPTGGSIGIGFAVPATIAVPVIEQLDKFGETRRGWLGVNIQSVTNDIVSSLGLSDDSGALIASVRKGSPAELAGLKTGDVILRFDGKAVTSVRSLPRMVARTAHGKSVVVDFVRDGKSRQLNVVVGRLETEEKKKASADDDVSKEKEDDKRSAPGEPLEEKIFLGMTLRPLDDELRKKYRLGPKTRGLVVSSVVSKSVAEEKDISVGDLVVQADQQPVFKIEDLSKAIERVKKRGRKAILLRLENAEGDLRFVALLLE